MAFQGLEIDSESKLVDVIFDLERQLNNLKLVSEVAPIGMHPRFWLGGDIDAYTITSTGDYALEGRPPSLGNQQKDLRVHSGQCQDSGVQKTPPLQSRESIAVSQEVRIRYIKKMIGHYESGLLYAREVLDTIGAALQTPIQHLVPSLSKEPKDETTDKKTH